MSYQNYRPAGFGGMPPVVKNLLILNGIFYLATFALGSRFNFDLNEYLGLHYFRSEKFYPHQLISYMFMHSTADISHILFNMLGVYMFGALLEQVWGSKKFLMYYLFSGIGAALLQMVILYFSIEPALNHHDTLMQGVQNPELILQAAQNRSDYLNSFVMIGASGALFGLLLAFGVLFPNTVIYLYFFFPLKAKYFVILYGLLELFFGVSNFSGDNVAHFAHLGGMLFGFIMLFIWKKKNGSFY